MEYDASAVLDDGSCATLASAGGASLSELGCQDMKGEYNSRCPCEA